MTSDEQELFQTTLAKAGASPERGKQRGDLVSTQQKSDASRLALIVLAFLCIFLIFMPDSLGLSMYDRATSEYRFRIWEGNGCGVTILGIISLSCLNSALSTHGTLLQKTLMRQFLVFFITLVLVLMSL
ncbi:MAG: hypothetical protein CMA47_00720 [Euryarchaeota archaeon]|nr:hypothetical protein [Euryarchaeota archaeon]